MKRFKLKRTLRRSSNKIISLKSSLISIRSILPTMWRKKRNQLFLSSIRSRRKKIVKMRQLFKRISLVTLSLKNP